MLPQASTSLLKLLLFGCCLLLYVPCEASDGEKRLYEYLFVTVGYNNEVRPRRDPTQSIVVDVELDLNHLIKLDEQTEVLQSSVIVAAEWNDDYLTWDPASYDGVTQIVLSPTKIWIPDIGIQNSATNFYPEDYSELFRVHVHHTGRVRWWFGGVMDTSCHLDGTLFPFDSQACSVIIESWAYSEAYVDLRNASNHVHLDGFNDDAIWHLLGTSVRKYDVVYDLEPTVRYSQIEFVLYLDRKPLYYVVNIILPCCLLIIISLLVYWMPPDSEEKISLSMTVLLAFSVFLYVVNEMTPASSDSTPIIGVFVMVTIGLSTASVITSIFVFRINDNTSPLPRGVRLVAFQYLARFMCVRVSWPTTSSSSRSSVVPDDSSCGRTSSNCSAKVTANPVSAATRRTVADVDDTRASSTSAGCCCQLKPQVDSVLCELRKITRRQQEVVRESENAQEWRTLAHVIDRLLFVISLTILVIVAVWMIAMSVQHPDIERHGAVYTDDVNLSNQRMD